MPIVEMFCEHADCVAKDHQVLQTAADVAAAQRLVDAGQVRCRVHGERKKPLMVNRGVVPDPGPALKGPEPVVGSSVVTPPSAPAASAQVTQAHPAGGGAAPKPPTPETRPLDPSRGKGTLP